MSTPIAPDYSVKSHRFTGRCQIAKTVDAIPHKQTHKEIFKCSCQLQAVLSEHSAEVVGVALHPTNKYFITASADKSWAFYDLESTLCMAQVHTCAASCRHLQAAAHAALSLVSKYVGL